MRLCMAFLPSNSVVRLTSVSERVFADEISILGGVTQTRYGGNIAFEIREPGIRGELNYKLSVSICTRGSLGTMSPPAREAEPNTKHDISDKINFLFFFSF